MTDQFSVFNNRSRDLTGLPSSRLQQHRGGDGGSCRRGKCYFAIPRRWTFLGSEKCAQWIDEKVVKVAIHGPVEEYLAHPNSSLSPSSSSGD
ncbi:hypothetical protein MRX96_020387 [Rhipicephalus microplus]